MKPCLAALALVLAPLPLAAQDLVFDTGALDACFAAGGWEDCVGAASGACMDATPGGESTLVMTGCLDAERQYWDDDLNAAFARLVEEARVADSASHQDPPPSREEALRDMQRAWIAFRDATCHLEMLDMYGGTGANLIWTGCLMRMTGEQALYLRSALAAG